MAVRHAGPSYCSRPHKMQRRGCNLSYMQLKLTRALVDKVINTPVGPSQSVLPPVQDLFEGNAGLLLADLGLGATLGSVACDKTVLLLLLGPVFDKASGILRDFQAQLFTCISKHICGCTNAAVGVDPCTGGVRSDIFVQLHFDLQYTYSGKQYEL